MRVQIAPDCDTKASLPGSAPTWLRLALSPVCGTSTPRLPGPSSRMPRRRAASSAASRRLRPWASRRRDRPSLTITPTRVPRCPSASMAAGTVSSGLQITASSGASGRLITSG